MSDLRYPPFPEGDYNLWADDDDLIGLTVAKTYPSGWPIVRTTPPLMDGFDEYYIGDFLARCLTHHEVICNTLGWDLA